MLREGEPAPDFDLPDADMNMVSLASFRNSRHVVLYFYPKDDNPGCTLEAIEFPAPVISVSITPESRSDRDKLSLALAKLAEGGNKLVNEGVGMIEKYKEVATYG